jgi:hypothetical protein
MVSLDGLDGQSRCETGRAYLVQGDFEAALPHLQASANLGPPCSAKAWYYCGQVMERYNKPGLALQCYIESSRLDEFAESPLERIMEVSKDSPLRGFFLDWASSRLLSISRIV